MATKSKAKKRPAKKMKRPVKKIKRRGSPKTGLALGIGVISTIKVPQSLRRAFKTGLNNPNVVIKVEHALSYKKNKLQQKIEQFNKDSAIGLIVTVGGLVACNVANSFATKPFISLTGAPPTSPGSKCFGGVTLQSYPSNPLRISYLNGKGFATGQIGLFYNPNSAMSGAETGAWTGATPPVPCFVDANGDNDPTHYTTDLSNFPASITAVVVSADPFFQETKDDLVAAANATGKYFCYALQDFGSASPAPTHGKATLYGPSLTDSFTLLGERAAKVLSTGAKLSPLFAAALDIVKDL